MSDMADEVDQVDLFRPRALLDSDRSFAGTLVVPPSGPPLFSCLPVHPAVPAHWQGWSSVLEHDFRFVPKRDHMVMMAG